MKVVLIVEGARDAEQVAKAFPGNDDVQTVITEGTKFNNKIIAQIEKILEDDDTLVYVFSDPDEAGDSLNRMVHKVFPQIQRLEADTGECSYFTGKKFKMGVEYASYKYLRKIINPILGLPVEEEETYDDWDNVYEA